MATSQSTIDTISNWYKDSLGRDADAGGLANWSSALDSGANLNDLYASFQTDAAKEVAARSSGGGLIDSQPTQSSSPTSFQFADYGGQQVRNDSAYKSDLADAASGWNKQTGNNLSVQDYDKMINPETYGARWGIPTTKTPAMLKAVGQSSPTETAATLLDPSSLARRAVDPRTETVSGQLDSILAKDSPYLQQARARGERVLAGRGLINSTMAGSAGEDAAISAALNIATPDASIYGRSSDYNTALTNQANMYNADTLNSFAGKRIDQANQMSLAKLQSDTAKYTAELNANTSRYNVDQDYKRTMDANRDSLINNILMQPADNMSPDRKAALLEQLGMGRAAKRDGSGNVVLGEGLAGAVYIIDSVAADLAPQVTPAWGGGN
jgi:hypothetical protein